MRVLSTIIFMLMAFEIMAFAPQNNYWVGPEKNISGMTETDFNEVVDTVIDVYRAEIESAGNKLFVNKQWNNGTVNASAVQYGNVWVFNLYGGLARFDGMTKDKYAMIVCHEMGHHKGGHPKYLRDGMETWASCEGQSDYFAGAKCYKRYYKAMYGEEPQEQEQQQGQQYVDVCKSVYTDEMDINACKSGLNAALGTAQILAKLGGRDAPSLDVEDDTIAYKTNQTGYPGVQCRLDTMRNGLYCDKNPISSNYCDAYDLGARPMCWYRE